MKPIREQRTKSVIYRLLPILEYLDLSNNQISDISALADLTGLWWLDLSNNYLDITDGSPAMQIINALKGMGVTVIYEPQKAYGDLSGDGGVDVQDAILVLRNIVGLVNLTDNQVVAADVNGDGKVDVQDAILILRYIVGLIEEFPVKSQV